MWWAELRGQVPALEAPTRGVDLPGRLCVGLGRLAAPVPAPVRVLHSSLSCSELRWGGLSGGLLSDLRLSKTQLPALGTEYRLGTEGRRKPP